MKSWLIAFFILQIGLDLAHSITAFPFVHYGMFSQSFPPPDTLTVFRVSVDGKALQPADFAVYRWDMVQGPLEAAEKHSYTDKKLQAALGSFYNDLRPNLDNTGEFTPWYKAYLGRLLGRPIAALRVDRVRYRWTAGHMVLIQTENRINE